MKTYANDYYGWSSIRSATLRSDNSVYAQLTLDVTPQKVADMARAWACARSSTSRARTCRRSASARSRCRRSTSRRRTRRSRPEASTPSRWRSAASFSPTGPSTRRRGGASPKRHRAISEGTAAIVTRILEQNVQSGTGTRAAFGRPAAGKTGTAELNVDAWFAGLHARPRDDRVDGLHARRDPARERARDRGDRGKLPGGDVAALHGARARGHRAAAFPEPKRVAGVEAVHARRVRALVRPERDDGDGPRRRPRRTTTPAGAAGRHAECPAAADDRRRRSRASSSTRSRLPTEIVAVADAAGRVLERAGAGERRSPSVPELGDGRLRGPCGRHTGRASGRVPGRRRHGAARPAPAGNGRRHRDRRDGA